jgi:uncharacterized protein
MEDRPTSDSLTPRRRRRLRALVIVAVVLSAVMAALWLFRETLTRSALFFPVRGQSRTPADLGLEHEELSIIAADGVRTQAWWIPAEPAAGAAPVVLFFRGNGGTMADWLDIVPPLRELGLAVMLAEYRGYGDSEGRPSEDGLNADAEAAVREARRRAAGAPLIVAGQSLGGAVAIHAAANLPVDALVAESTFTSLPDMASAVTHIPLARILVAYRFDSLAKIRRVAVPILIVHGDADELVPFEMGERLRDAATAAPAVRFHRVRGGRHNDIREVGGADYWRAWRELLPLVAPRAR